MLAGHRHLGNLTLIIDRNRLQQGAGTEQTNALEPLAAKWEAFGWQAVEVDGHDPAALLAVLRTPAAGRDRPLCVIARTVKGRGVSFMENEVHWHHGVLNRGHFDAAMAELAA